ncbi:YceH family protein [Pelagicoccus sp. SDUM812003]|uniref:YceH family protein n=1 Tax=Pelagicoccus sp. SDUM812003 TaxID=3041267 RepID=UPI00280FA2D3|nr:YceH family protein [Pelagicoccus sp. SDUM812003]MDQ8202958.1 YceH family protein [Pelagicoccus sp. SDUM812003]
MSDSSTLPHQPLSIVEARILGCLCEKEATTPDYYPLTLNSLIAACNQKSNRAPVLELDDSAVDAGTESLRAKHLAARVTQAEARVAKFKHTLDSVYPIPDPQRAILTELLLRGPQTAGELRSRCERMHRFASLDEVREELGQMASGDFPLVVELPRQPGKKDARFAHLLSGEPEIASGETAAIGGPLKVEVSTTLPAEAEARIATLEQTVARQAEELAALRQELAAFRAQFE